jgi:autotransporter-associated beta strand protein
MKPHFSQLLLASAFTTGQIHGEVRIETTFSVGADIPDRGQYVDVRSVANTGLSSILDVDVDLVLASATGSQMRLGDLYATLTYGTASEAERVSVLLNRVGATNTTTWGSSLSSINLTLDDSAPTNVFSATSGTGTYAADGRLANPYSSPLAYDPTSVTAGLSVLNGDILSSNKWSLLIADVRQGGASRLNGWTLKLTGTAATDGTMDLGDGGKISDLAGSEDSEVKANFAVNGTGSSEVTAAVSQNLILSGGLTGSGDLKKTGSGTLTLSGSSPSFTGSVILTNGSVEIASSTALGSNGTLEILGNEAKLTLSKDSTLSATVTLGAPGMTALMDGSGSITGSITGGGGLRKTGAGTISLDGEANFSGATFVEEGALAINGTLSGSSGLTVGDGATLKGSGVVNVSTSIYGNHAAGNSPGLQVFTNGLSYGSTATVSWEFEGNALETRGFDFDAIDVTGGDLSIASGALLRLLAGQSVDYSTSPWSSARNFTVIDFSSGGFSSGMFTLDTSLDGGSSNYGTWGLVSQDGSVVLNWTPIPEPGGVTLLSSLALLALAKRRR